MCAPDAVIHALVSMRRPVVIGHVTPDADGLAAMIGIAHGFAEAGRREPTVSLPAGSLSQRLRFMVEQAQPALADAAAFANADGFVVVDTAKPARCNVDASIPDGWLRAGPVVNIDHHASNTRFGTVNWVEADASSTSELVFLLLQRANRPLTPLICSLLYAGILTDTVGFTLATSRERTFRVAADLVAHGADVAWIGTQIYRSRSPGEFRLLQTVYANTRLAADNRIGYSTASYEEIVGAGCSAADIDEQVSIPRLLGGTQIAILLSEGNPGKTRVNLRGESGLNVLELARSLGGGGHADAAGVILDLKLAEAVPLVLRRATEYLETASNGQVCSANCPK
jgi:phosphoesterase RecJ-like protein